jgi:hypothetical protein
VLSYWPLKAIHRSSKWPTSPGSFCPIYLVLCGRGQLGKAETAWSSEQCPRGLCICIPNPCLAMLRPTLFCKTLISFYVNAFLLGRNVFEEFLLIATNSAHLVILQCRTAPLLSSTLHLLCRGIGKWAMSVLRVPKGTLRVLILRTSCQIRTDHTAAIVG